jgi:CubicO group peptidase (beta-lactamase class C family)
VRETKVDMKLSTCSRLLFALVPACAGSPQGSSSLALGDMPASTPEAKGYSSAAFDAVGDYASYLHLRAGLVLVGDQVIYGWGDVAARLHTHSARLGLISALYGPAVASGQIALDSTLAQHLIDDMSPSLTAAEQQATVEDLLESRSGVYHYGNGESITEAATTPPRGSHAPGTFWFFNDWDFDTAGAIYEQMTGHNVYAMFADQIAIPIGMQDYTPADGGAIPYVPTNGDYEIDSPEQSSIPCETFHLSARDMARFGQLYLHGGAWNGQQIIPADWVTTSTSALSTTTNAAADFGYMWYVGNAGDGFGNGAFGIGGLMGHYIIVLPSLDMVVVTQGDDGYYKQDPADHEVGFDRLGHLLSLIAQAQQ